MIPVTLRDEIESMIYLNNKGQIVVESLFHGYDEIQSFVEDNIVDSPNEQGETINWPQVWKDYDEWVQKNDDKKCKHIWVLQLPSNRYGICKNCGERKEIKD